MKDRLKRISAKVHRAHGELCALEKSIDEWSTKKSGAELRTEHAVLAKQLVLAVAEKTQGTIGTRISSLVSMALAAVFDDPYRFEVEFVQRRGTTEADLWFLREENKIEPLTASGGGPVDVASFALRLAIWSLSKTAPVFLLDEPFRNLSTDRHAKAGLMLRELSKKMGIQIIMVSHNPEIIEGADRVFRIDEGKVVVE